MASNMTQDTVERVVAFHGHLCPGLMTGVRAAEIALREIGAHAQDEEVIAVVETVNCAVDAIQVLVGCTYGKGNLFHLDYGKNAFTFARRSDGKAIRVASRPRPSRSLDPEQEALVQRARSGEATEAEQRAYQALWRERALGVLALDESELFVVQGLNDFALPPPAEIHPSVVCAACGEMVMSSRIQRLGELELCLPCYWARRGEA